MPEQDLPGTNNDCDLEAHRAEAEKPFRNAATGCSAEDQADNLKQQFAALNEESHFERQIAGARGEEYAEPIDFPLKWDIGAPLPHVMINDGIALLAFCIKVPNPDWDGTFVTVKSVEDTEPEQLALVTFHGVVSAKLGAPNDEVLGGHPLYGRGLSAYEAQRVVNSKWLKELQDINRVHRYYREERWKNATHFVFWFHDSTFECVADSYSVETHKTTWKTMFTIMADCMEG